MQQKNVIIITEFTFGGACMKKTSFNSLKTMYHRFLPILFRCGMIILVAVLTLFLTMCKPSATEPSDSSDSGGEIDSTTGTNINGSETGSEENSTTNDVSNSGGSNSTGSKSTSPAGSVNDPSKNIEVVNNCYVTGRKIAKNTITFNIMVRDNSNGLAKYNDSAFAKYVLDNFNIKLNFELVAVDAVSEKLTLSLASKKLPDMYWGMAGTKTILNNYIGTKGYFIELSQYFDKFGPNIKAMFKSAPETAYVATHDDGKIYMLPLFQKEDNFSWKFFINKTWLSNLGLSMPTTTEELFNVLMEFKNQDANRNGNLTDEIPMMIPYGEKFVNDLPNSLFSPFGVYMYNDGWAIDQNTDKIQLGYVTNEYRNGLRYYKRLRDAGLLDSGFLTSDLAKVRSRTSDSVQTVGVFAARIYSEAVSAESFMANYTLLPPLTDNPSRPGRWVNTNYDSLYAEWFVLTSACKYPEAAIRLADWLYSTEGSLSVLMGPPGDKGVWKYDSSGKVVNVKVNLGGKSLSEYLNSLTPGYSLPHYFSDEVNKLGDSIRDPYVSPATKAYNSQLKAMYQDRPQVKSAPHLYFNSKEHAEYIAADVGDFHTYARQMKLRFITGQSSIDNDWDNYIKQMNRLGADKVTQLQQSAYNRYKVWQKNKK